MLLERDRKLFFIFAAISVALSIIVCVPFSLEKVTLFEILFKYAACPLAIAVFTLLSFGAKYRSYRPAVKYTTLVAYTPLFSYVVALLFNTISIIVRNNDVYNPLKTNIYLMGIAAILVIILFIANYFPKFVLVFSKNEAILVDVLIGVLSIAYLFAGLKIALDYRTVGFDEKASVFFIIIPLVIGLALGYLHFEMLRKEKAAKQEYSVQNREDLIKLWKENKEHAKAIYDAAKEDILGSLFGYSLNSLGYEEADEQNDVPEVVDVVSTDEYQALAANNEELAKRIDELVAQNQALQEQLNRLQAIIDSSKDKIVETLQKCADNDTDLIVDSLQHSLDVLVSERDAIKVAKDKLVSELSAQKAELQAIVDAHNAKLAEEAKLKAEAEEKARLDAERRAQEALERAKDKKPIEPAFEEFTAYATSIGANLENFEVSINDKQTQYKYVYKGDTFLTLQKTNNDYKVIFFAKTEEMRELLYQFNGIVAFDKKVEYEKAKYELQQLKASYKGEDEFTFDVVKKLMDASLANLIDAEAKEDEAIALEKAAKERAKLAERALREKEKQIAKEEAKKLAAEQKAKEEAEENEQPASNNDEDAA